MLTLFIALCVAVWSLKLPVASSQGSPPVIPFKNFESPQVHPLALTPDGTRLLAVNSPNATLSVFQLVSGSPVLTAEIPVGFEPVSVAARNNREAWVVNWMSDSVSIVDLTTGNVVRSFDVGDEPTDVIFAG
ncbi:MAG: YncE family protein, partial [Pyrinomonadaceae bacterium]